MSQTIKIANYAQINILEQTHLTAAATAGQPTITVANNNNFVANSHYIVGTPAGENTEKLLALSVSGSTGITATTNLVFAHALNTKVTELFGDQIRVYRASNVDGTAPTDASFSLLATVDIDFDDNQTTYTDSSGSSDYWYKSVYYDSVGNSETSLANSRATRGGGYGNYATLSSIRNQAGLNNNRYISDAKIEEKRQAAQALINSRLSGKYTVPFTAPINQLIAEMTRVLAAGYLLTEEFGASVNTGFFNEGQAMIDRVTNANSTGLLDKLAMGELTLINESGEEQSLTTGTEFSSWPNDTTEDASASNSGGERMFRVSDVY